MASIQQRIRTIVQANATLSTGIGATIKRVDTTLVGPHTQRLYDGLSKKEARSLIQLRTRVRRLNEYLSKINSAESLAYACGVDESVKHHLLMCVRWAEQKEELIH